MWTLIQHRNARALKLGTLVLLAGVIPFPSFAAQVAQNAANYPIHGIVVNSVSGEPVHGALVQIFAGRQRSVLTGADGAFHFADVPAGSVNVNVHKPGFFTEQEIHSPRAQAIFTTSGPDQPPVVIKLVPEGVITGRIIGDGGEPVEDFPVQVLVDHVENGKRIRSNFRSATSNEEGEFRLAELPPGKYFVFAGPSARPEFALQGGPQPIVVGYPGAFYPGAADISGAGQVEVAAGQRAEINFTFQSQAFHRISGTVSGYAQDRDISLQVINAVGQQMPAGFRFDPRNGTFRTLWLPAGSYRLTAETRDPRGQRGYFASQSVNLNTNIEGVHLNLLPGVNIPVNARVEKTRNDGTETRTVTYFGQPNRRTQRQVEMPAQVRLIEHGAEFSQQQQRFAQFGEAEDSPLEVTDVPPGVYTVQIIPNGPWYVESARSGSLNLLEQDLTVTAGSAVQPIEIVLRDDCASLEGKILMGTDSESAMVITIPEGSQQIPIPGTAQLAITDALHPTAIFSMGQLAPGIYKVLAVDQVDGFEYGNPEVLQKYLSKAQEISLVANQRGKIELELVHIGD
jgi:hypothetical protein